MPTKGLACLRFTPLHQKTGSWLWLSKGSKWGEVTTGKGAKCEEAASRKGPNDRSEKRPQWEEAASDGLVVGFEQHKQHKGGCACLSGGRRSGPWRGPMTFPYFYYIIMVRVWVCTRLELHVMLLDFSGSYTIWSPTLSSAVTRQEQRW